MNKEYPTPKLQEDKMEALQGIITKRSEWANILEEPLKRLPMIPLDNMTEKDLLAERAKLEHMLVTKDLTYALAERLYMVRKYLRRFDSLRKKEEK